MNKTYSNHKLKILSSGDPQTNFHRFQPAEILALLGPPRRLLSSSTKIAKCLAVGILARIIYFTPGIFCPAATKGCRNACLGHTSGMMQFPTHAAARDRRAALYLEHPSLFLKRLRSELTLLETDALQYGLQPAVRLNGTSDLSWEILHPDLFAEFPNIQFFDYTKLYGRMLDFLECTFPANYHLTFSGDARNTHRTKDVLHRGGTVAMVFWPNLPQTWQGYQVIDGDLHDARFLDRESVVVGLRAKGLARVDTTGFVSRPCPTCGPDTQLAFVSLVECTHRNTLHECSKCSFKLKARWKLPSTSPLSLSRSNSKAA